MTIDNIDIEATLQKVERLLSEEKGLSASHEVDGGVVGVAYNAAGGTFKA